MAATPSNEKLENSEAINEACDELEATLAQLRLRYDQYFLGMERQAPSLEHQAYRRRLLRVTNAFTRATATRFRVQSIAQKTTTYERMWARTVQEIENGTYKRDLFKARLHSKEKTPDEVAAAKAKAEAARLPAPVKSAAAPVPAAALSDAKVRAIYDAYVTAKRKCNEDVSKLNMDSLAATLRKQVPELLKKHGAKDVDFKVVIKDGKASLRAFPK